jgi:hypothetical protein
MHLPVSPQETGKGSDPEPKTFPLDHIETNPSSFGEGDAKGRAHQSSIIH